MSRYSDVFRSHPFQTVFKDLTMWVNDLQVNDISQTNVVDEVFRIKQVCTYLNEILNSIDPELTPLTVWDSFYQYTQNAFSEVRNYFSNNNITHLINANTNFDTLLNLVRPYLLSKGKAKTLHENVFAQTQKNLKEYLDSFKVRADQLLAQLETNINNAQVQTEQMDAYKSVVEDFYNRLTGANGIIGISTVIENTYTDIAIKDQQINELHNKLLVDAPKSPSIQTVVQTAREEVEIQRKAVISMKLEAESTIQELEAFHVKIFGKPNDENKLVGGLSNELTERLQELEELGSTNKIKYDALVTQIESLLPGATSAGLASAYRQMKESYKTSILIFSLLFFLAITLIAAVSIHSIKSINKEREASSQISALNFALSHATAGKINSDKNAVSNMPASQAVSSNLSFANAPAPLETWDMVAKNLILRLPLFGALIWFAFFVSKRRSEAQRLQQEYAHKEALATSYASYKEQIEALDSEDKILQKVFIEKMVDAIAYNASETLDGNHGDKHPVHSAFEKFADKIENISLVEFIKVLRKSKR